LRASRSQEGEERVIEHARAHLHVEDFAARKDRARESRRVKERARVCEARAVRIVGDVRVGGQQHTEASSSGDPRGSETGTVSHRSGTFGTRLPYHPNMLRRAVFAFAVIFLTPTIARADREPVYPLDVAVTSDENGAVVDRKWIDAELAVAEHIFGPLGIHFRVNHVRALGSELTRLEDPRLRDRFATQVTPHEIQIFAVRSLRDDAQVGLYRRGVTWDSRTTPSRRYIIIAAEAGPSTLAHELGHFFGMPTHSTVENNLMSYNRTSDALLFLDASQQAIVKSTAHTLRMSGSLSVLDWVEK
jgi:hypothetical protein